MSPVPYLAARQFYTIFARPSQPAAVIFTDIDYATQPPFAVANLRRKEDRFRDLKASKYYLVSTWHYPD